MQFFQIIVSFLLASFAYAQSLTTEIAATYNFSPSALNDSQREEKVPALDRFWTLVKGDTQTYLPLLRAELQNNGHQPFFYYDGSSLLLSLTDNSADKKLAIEAIAKCNIADISPRIYVQTLNKFALDGYEVTTPAMKILFEEKFSFFLPKHAMTFNQGYCLAYMLLPQKQSHYVDTLIRIFPTVSSSSQMSIITTLWFGYTCKGDAFLKSISDDSTVAKEVSKYAKRILGYQLGKERGAYIETLSAERVEDMRKESLTRFSDEYIEILDMTTKVLRKDNCR